MDPGLRRDDDEQFRRDDDEQFRRDDDEQFRRDDDEQFRRDDDEQFRRMTMNSSAGMSATMTDALRVLLVEDEPLARERIGDLVRATPGLTLVGEATNGLEALNQVAALAPDLLLLDVQMPELGGFEVVRALEPERAPGIVFITAWDEHAIRAFEVNAIDYLLKPVAAERFAASMVRAITRLQAGTPAPLPLDAALRRPGQYRTRFVVRQGTRHTFVAASEVCWLEGEDNYLRLHVMGKNVLVRGTMKDAEAELDPATFVRIHRGVIVNVNHIVGVEWSEAGHYVVRLDDGSHVRSSRQYSAAVRALVAPLGKTRRDDTDSTGS